MLGGAAEAIVEIEIATRGVDIVPPQERRNPAPGPHAFGRPSRERQPRGGLLILLDLFNSASLRLLLNRRLVLLLSLGLVWGRRPRTLILRRNGKDGGQ